ncbi:MAG: hypothetical protein OXI41_03360 [Chloroflexota bacterium]|nr:hypothetical protein [Chloroflexota bacterium]MDE2895708.1 hypothetical protein [Chloroflexota bacterium]
MPSTSEVSDEELDKVVKKIRSQLDGEQWKIVEGRLAYPNEPNFGERLRDLLQPIKGHLGNSDERKSFVYKASAMRNILTHQREPRENVDMSPESLIVVTRKIRAVVQTKLLDLLGFSAAEIDSIVMHQIKNRLDVFLL